jgi:mono/diheme cytochrome c family protein
MKQLLILFLSLLLCGCNSNKKSETISYAQNNDLKTSITRGKEVYNDLCITCHLANGKGVERAFPPLAGSDYLKTNQEQSIKAVKYGMSGKIVVNGIEYNSVMAPLGLSNEEVADVMNYINNSWGNSYGKEVTPLMVSEIQP